MTNKITRELTTEFTPEMLEELKRSLDKANGPDRSRACLVVPPAMFDQLTEMTVQPFSTSKEDEKAFRYSTFGNSLYRMPVYRMHPAVVGRMYSVDPKPVVWRDEVKPIKPTKAELAIIIASIALILFLSCSVFN